MRDPKTKKSRRVFRPWEAEQIASDKASLRKALESPHIEDKSAVRATIQRLTAMEAEHAVPDFTPKERDVAAKRVKELEEQIKVGMLSHEEMRRNPPGAVDQNVWWEKRNKRRINLWRGLQSALHKGIPADQAQSLLNIERLRPRTNAYNMDNAQIPQARSFSFPSEAYKENYDNIFRPEVEEPASPMDVAEPEEESLLDAAEQEAALAQPETQRALGRLAKQRPGAVA